MLYLAAFAYSVKQKRGKRRKGFKNTIAVGNYIG
jgi:hypothetical protein